MAHVFQETEEIEKKNRGKSNKKVYYDKSLTPYLKNRNISIVENKVRKIYKNCKICNDPLSNKILMVIGYCMVCEKG